MKAQRKPIVDEDVTGLDVNGIKKGRKNIKNKIQFAITLNPEQKEVKSGILKDSISVLTGKAGSGKTLVASLIALEYLFYREVEKVVITRPTVSDEDIGFLPGDVSEKLAPWMAPIYANMYAVYGKARIDKLVSDNVIEIAPISFLRGRTFVNSCLITGETVLTEHGHMKIEDVFADMQIGTYHKLLSHNIDTGEDEYNVLSALMATDVAEYVEIELEDGVLTRVSPGHKFYTTNGLVEAKDLTIDDEILSLGINSKKIKSIRLITEDETKYSLNVDNNHNYYSTGNLLSKNCIIVDEAQNITKSQMEMVLTRLGVNSKMMICGDASQNDLKHRKDSGFPYLLDMATSIDGLNVYELKTNHRHPIVDDILNYFEKI